MRSAVMPRYNQARAVPKNRGTSSTAVAAARLSRVAACPAACCPCDSTFAADRSASASNAASTVWCTNSLTRPQGSASRMLASTQCGLHACEHRQHAAPPPDGHLALRLLTSSWIRVGDMILHLGLRDRPGGCPVCCHAGLPVLGRQRQHVRRRKGVARAIGVLDCGLQGGRRTRLQFCRIEGGVFN